MAWLCRTELSIYPVNINGRDAPICKCEGHWMHWRRSFKNVKSQMAEIGHKSQGLLPYVSSDMYQLKICDHAGCIWIDMLQYNAIWRNVNNVTEISWSEKWHQRCWTRSSITDRALGQGGAPKIFCANVGESVWTSPLYNVTCLIGDEPNRRCWYLTNNYVITSNKNFFFWTFGLGSSDNGCWATILSFDCLCQRLDWNDGR